MITIEWEPGDMAKLKEPRGEYRMIELIQKLPGKWLVQIIATEEKIFVSEDEFELE